MPEFDWETAAPVSPPPQRLRVDIPGGQQSLDGQPDFDWSSVTEYPLPRERVYVESQNSVVDLPSGGIARLQAIAGGSYDKGLAGRRLNDMYARQMFGEDTPEIQNSINQIRQQIGGDIETANWFESIVRDTAEVSPQLVGLLGKVSERGIEGSMIAGTSAAVIGQNPLLVRFPEEAATVPGAALAGFVIGGRFGAAEYSFMQNSGEAYGEISEFLDKEGVKLENKNLARLGAVMIGATNAGMDTISLGALTKVFFGKNLVIDRLKSAGIKSIAIPKTKEAVYRFILDLSKSIAIETATEGAQEAVLTQGGNLTKYLSDQEFDYTTWDEMWGRVGEAAQKAFNATLGLGGVAGGVKTTMAGVRKSVDAAREKMTGKPEGSADIAGAELPGVEQIAPEQGQDVLTAADAEATMRGTEASKIYADVDTKVASMTEDQMNLRLDMLDKKTEAAIITPKEMYERDAIKDAVQKQVEYAEDRNLAEVLDLERKQFTTLQESRERWREMTSSVRDVTALTKKQIKETQTKLLEFVEQSGLEAADKAKFLATLKNTQTSQQLVKAVDEIDARIDRLVDASTRRSTIASIKGTLKKAKRSKVIAVDFAKQIEEMVGEIDTRKRRPETLERLQKTLEFMQKNPGAEMPKDAVDRLGLLNKKRLEDIGTEDLVKLKDDIEALAKLGRTKFELMQRQKVKLKEKRLAELKKDSVQISAPNTKRAPIGERLAEMDKIKNMYADAKGGAQRAGVAINPMDVFFDMLDGAKGYIGANYRIFKRTVDAGYSKYLNLKRSKTQPIKDLADKLDMNAQNFERIGVYAAAQQEGGVQKLLDSGITQTEIDGITLTAEEMQIYTLMREALDSMLPAIREIMRTVYNMDVEAIKNYFPFLTDFDAVRDFEVQDQIGDNAPTIGMKKNVEKGFTIKRTLGKQAIRVDAMGVFMKHVDNATYLIEMGEIIKSLGDVATSKEYGEMVGDIGQEMVVEWINLLARNGKNPNHHALSDWFRRNIGRAVLGFKLSTIVIQPTALLDGSALVGGDYVARGTNNVLFNKEWRLFIRDNMPEVRERIGDDPAYAEMGGDNIVGKASEAGFWALKRADLITAMSIASGAYVRSVESRGGTVDLSNPDQQAIQEAQLWVRRTQSSAYAKDAPPAISRGGLTGNVSFDKLILQFQSFMLNRWSEIRWDMWRLGIREGKTARALNIATFLTLANLAEYGGRAGLAWFLATLIGYDDDDKKEDDPFTEKAVKQALSNVPFVSQAVSAMEYGNTPVPLLGITQRALDEIQYADRSKASDKKIQHYSSAAILALGLLGMPGALQAEQIVRKSMKDNKGVWNEE